MATENVIKELNKVLANAVVFYHKTLHFHWSVTGAQFFELHEQFEQLYDRWKELVDDSAERVVMIGGRPVPTLQQALELADIKEEPSVPSARDMVKSVIADLKAQLQGFKKTIVQAEEVNDRTTANILDDIVDETNKRLWMLEAYVK